MEQDLINMRKSLDNMKWALNGLINLQSRCGSDEKELKKKIRKVEKSETIKKYEIMYELCQKLVNQE